MRDSHSKHASQQSSIVMLPEGLYQYQNSLLSQTPKKKKKKGNHYYPALSSLFPRPRSVTGFFDSIKHCIAVIIPLLSHVSIIRKIVIVMPTSLSRGIDKWVRERSEARVIMSSVMCRVRYGRNGVVNFSWTLEWSS